jgi:valyl-tRNA synthetase
VIRSELKVPLHKEADVILVTADGRKRRIIQEGNDYIQRLAKVAKVDCRDALDAKPEQCGTAVASDIEVYVPLKGLIDVDHELLRLSKEDSDLLKQLELIKKKLTNEGFINQAPNEVIEREREKERQYVAKRKVLQEQMANLKS